MKKIIKIASLILALCGILCVCSACGNNDDGDNGDDGINIKTNVSYTYTVETGDKVKVQLDTSNGHKMNSDLPFSITKNDEVISQGTFITADGYAQYKSVVESGANAGVTIIKQETIEDDITYIFYKVNGDSGVEYDYIIKINDSNTGVVIGSLKSQEEAESVFKHITISIVK
jgi:hypothetical protein